MLNKDIPAEVMLYSDELLRLWATSEDYTLYCGPGTEETAERIKARYPNHAGPIELGIHLRRGMMTITREYAGFSGVLPRSILLG